MTYIISMQDILSEQWALNGEQLILRILKSKGAPVKGIIYLNPDTESYEWQMLGDRLAGVIKYRVEVAP